MRLSEILKNNRWYLIPYLTIFLLCVGLLLSYDRATLHLSVNRYHTAFWDSYFRLVTQLGSGVVIIPLCLLTLCRSYRSFFVCVGSAVGASLVTQIGKRLIWTDSPRPSVFFRDLGYDLHIVDNVHLHSTHSFPSGHATGAFAIFTALALLSKKPFWKVFWLVLALTGSFSRIYLSQHFLVDITVGSLIGTTGAVLVYWWISQYSQVWIDRSPLQQLRQKDRPNRV